MVSNMAKLTGYTENGSIRSVNGGFHRRETKSRQSATPPVRNIFMPPEPKSKVRKYYNLANKILLSKEHLKIVSIKIKKKLK